MTRRALACAAILSAVLLPASARASGPSDGIQYFEPQPASAARKVLFVRVGQDEPLFDDATLRLLPPR